MPTRTQLRSPLGREFRFATRRLNQIRANPSRFIGQRDGTYANLLIGLASEALTTHAHAMRAYREQSLPYLAWATRGLFELALWAEYCTQARANAQRFV